MVGVESLTSATGSGPAMAVPTAKAATVATMFLNCILMVVKDVLLEE